MERSVTASLMRGVLCLFAGLFMTGFAFTHPNPTGTGPDACPPVNPAFALSVGDTFSVGDRQIVFRAERTHASAAGEGGEIVAADLLIRMRDETTHVGRVGSYVPHLQVSYEATWFEDSIQSGEARFRLTGDGPGYGFDLKVPGDALAGDEIQIRFSIDNDGATPHNGGSCRLPTAIFTTLNVGDLPQAPTESLTDSEVDADPLRMNLLSNLDPRAPDGYNDIWGWNNGTTYLAILGTVNGSSFIDVTDPLNPVEVGYIAGVNSSWRDMKAFGNYVYIGSEGGNSGIQVVDVSDPFNPTLVNTYTATVSTSHNVVMDEGLGHLYVVGSQSGTRILDVATDPVNITEIGDWQPRYVHDAYVANGRAYFSEINNGLQDVLDATDPANLSSIKTWTTPLDFTHNCWVNDDETLIVTTDEQTSSPVAVYDISDLSAPGDPPLLSEFQPDVTTIPHNAMFDDEDNHRVAISHYGIGLQYFDAFNPEIPVTLGTYDTYPNGDTGFNGAWGVYPFDPRGTSTSATLDGPLRIRLRADGRNADRRRLEPVGRRSDRGGQGRAAVRTDNRR